MKLIGAALAVAVLAALFAGNDDIRRFRAMGRM